MKITKDDLIKKNALLEKEVEDVNAKNRFNREMFSRIVGGTKTDQWGNEKMTDLSWLEIAHKVGVKDGLIQNMVDSDLIKKMECMFGEVFERISKIENDQEII